MLLLTCGQAFSQQKNVKMVASGKNAEKIVQTDKLLADVEYLTDTTFKGRAMGTKGATEAAFWIARKFHDDGLIAMNGNWGQSFQASDEVGHNIIGFLPGNRNNVNETYIIVSAHYDSFGKMEDKLLPGADSNASGVVAMVTIADMFKKMKDLGRSYGSNIIFIGMDGKERNSAGAEAFMKAVIEGRVKDPINQKPIAARQIKSAVVIDIIGGTISPIHKGRKDYLIMLGNPGDRYYLTNINMDPSLRLDIGYDYYGSKSFTEMFSQKIGDQKVFRQNGIPTVLFTSGITMKTNKVTDDADSLNYEIFRQRIILIFHWLTKVL